MTPDQLAALLDEIGKRLGPSGEYVFRIAVQRVVISSIVSIVVSLAIIVGFAVYVPLVVRSYRRWSPKPNAYSSGGWSDDLGFPLILGGMAFGIIACLAVGILATSVISLLTPEYTALRDILSAIGVSK